MEIVKKVLTDALVLRPNILEDGRGYFYESFNFKDFESFTGTAVNFIQENQSFSSKGTLRGLHFQKGTAAQAKLVRVSKGAAFDVAVDLRPDSSTFKQWYGVELTEKNHLQFFIPRGFAHGFLALEDNTIFQYKVDNYYSPYNEGGLIWDDEEIAIRWPNLKLELSEKDKYLSKFQELNFNLIW
jgi:dTDP-4-dehydrorhamnose 3,5-epimerase